MAAWKRMKADKYGIVTIEGRHRYAAGPECICLMVCVPVYRGFVGRVTGEKSAM